MDIRLIFRDFCVIRWGDECQYIRRIIGFASGARRKPAGKSAGSRKALQMRVRERLASANMS